MSSVAVGLTAGVFLSVAVISTPAPAQPAIGTARDFATSEFYDPPHETQVKWRITGAEAQLQSGGRYLVQQLKLETFRTNGDPEIIVDAPRCLYDSAQGQANSAGRLAVRAGDGRLSVDGEGFLWQQRGGSLTISNQVRAVIQRAATNAADLAPLVITSRWFTFEATNRSAVFHDDVRGEDAEMTFTCGRLAVHAAPGSRSFEVIEAGPSLTIVGKTGNRRAAADRAVYTRATERVELTGHVTWQQDQQSGRADRAVVRRLEQAVTADGHVALKLPRDSLIASGLLLSTNRPSPAAAEAVALVDLFADRFHSRSNATVAEGAVRLVDGTNRLSCHQLTLQPATATAPDETATAQGNVRIEHGDGTLRAVRAVYSRTNATVVFTGQPSWSQGGLAGRAERVTVRTDTGEIHAENEVAVKVSLGGGRASFLNLFPAETPTNGEPREIEVFARDFTAREHAVVFRGEVRAHELPVTGAEPRLQCDELEVRFAPVNRQAEWLQARQNVLFRQGVPGVTNGPATPRQLSARTLTARANPATGALVNLVAEGEVQVEQPGSLARGGQASYTAATDLLELTDGPWLDTPQFLITGARTLFWDQAKARFTGRGPFKIQFKPETVKQTTEKLKTP